MKKPFLVLLSGPTGVGKSILAEQLAQHIPAEIVNGDMGQCYTPLTIGTAKPSWRSSSIPHHLFDCVHEPRDITVVEYRNLVASTLEGIWSRNHIPIIVGGSSYYLASLFFPPQVTERTERISSRSLDPEHAWEHLYKIDPERAQEIDRHDIYRIERALEIWYTTGTKPSALAPLYNPLSLDFRYLFCIRDRADLHARINRRVKDMIAAGWISEVHSLMGTPWEPFLLHKKIIGYDDIIRYIHQPTHSEKEREIMIHTIAQRTRRYAKRQMTFWRTFSRNMHPYAAQQLATIDMSHDPDILLHNLVASLQREAGL